jgi:hypothetical protein
MTRQELKSVVTSIVEDTIDHQFHTFQYGNNSYHFWNLIGGNIKVGAYSFHCNTSGIVAGNRASTSNRMYNIVHSHFDGIVDRLVKYLVASNQKDHWFLQQVHKNISNN